MSAMLSGDSALPAALVVVHFQFMILGCEGVECCAGPQIIMYASGAHMSTQCRLVGVTPPPPVRPHPTKVWFVAHSGASVGYVQIEFLVTGTTQDLGYEAGDENSWLDLGFNQCIVGTIGKPLLPIPAQKALMRPKLHDVNMPFSYWN